MISSRADASVLLKSRCSRPPLSIARGFPSSSTTLTRAEPSPNCTVWVCSTVPATWSTSSTSATPSRCRSRAFGQVTWRPDPLADLPSRSGLNDHTR